MTLFALVDETVGQSHGPDRTAPIQGAAGRKVHVIGGAFEAGELDAKKAINQAARLAASL